MSQQFDEVLSRRLAMRDSIAGNGHHDNRSTLSAATDLVQPLKLATPIAAFNGGLSSSVRR